MRRLNILPNFAGNPRFRDLLIDLLLRVILQGFPPVIPPSSNLVFDVELCE